jgi:hypothetical protein
VGVQGAVFQKSPLAAGGQQAAGPYCTALEFSDATNNISNPKRVSEALINDRFKSFFNY